MTSDEIKIALKTLNALFQGQVNDVQAVMLRDKFKDLSRDAVMSAIKLHREKREGFWDLAQLLEGCRAAERGAQTEARQYIPDQSFAAVYRKQRPDLKKANDYEVIIRVHRQWWRECCLPDPKIEGARIPGSDGYRRKFTSSCINALCSAGMELEQAERLSGYIFLEHPRDLQYWLDDVRRLTSPAEAKANAAASAAVPAMEFA